jgi:hypothetical protein
LSYKPTKLKSKREETTHSSPEAEPPQWVILLLAAGMGAVGGAVLSFAQWLAMRSKVKSAGVWIPANMLAWLFGMPVIFWGIDLAFKMSAVWQSVLRWQDIVRCRRGRWRDPWIIFDQIN